MSQTPDELLMTALYDQHARPLMAFVLKYAESRGHAEDVVQETLLRAWRNLDRLDTAHGNPRAYLMTIARNVLTDQARARRVRPQVGRGDQVLALLPTANHVDATLERLLVGEALERLTPEHRGVVRALYYQGLTTDEAAEALEIPTGTVKSRSYYALRALRAALEEMGVMVR